MKDSPRVMEMSGSFSSLVTLFPVELNQYICHYPSSFIFFPKKGDLDHMVIVLLFHIDLEN